MNKVKLLLKKTAAALLCAVIGGILSCGGILSLPSPFAAVLPAVLSPIYGAAAIIGTAVCGAFAASFRIIPTVAAGVAVLISGVRIKGICAKHKGFACAAISSAVYLIFSSAVFAFSSEGAADLWHPAVMSVVLFAADAAFSEAASRWRSASVIPSALALLLCGIAVCSLCPLNVDEFALGGAAAAYIILFSSMRFGPTASASAALVCAIGAAVSSPALFADFALLGIPALICSLSVFDGSVRSSVAFIISAAAILTVFGGNGDASLVLSCVVGVAAFVLTYRFALKFFADIFDNSAQVPRSFRAEALRTVLQNISDRVLNMRDVKAQAFRPLSDSVYSKVCLGCQKNASCFDNDGSALSGLERISEYDDSELSLALPLCTKIPEIRRVSVETARRREYISDVESERRNAASLCFQMLSVLESASEDAESAVLKSVSADPRLSKRLSAALKREGVRFIRCSVYPGLDAEVAFSETARINEVKIASIAEALTGAEYSKPECCKIGCGLILRLTTKSEYVFEAGGCQIYAKQDASGDVAQTFSFGHYSYALLSDGMGVGSPAREVSLKLCGLLKELIGGGYSVDTAIRVSSLVVSSSVSEESFATLDLLRFNRSTGAAEIYKAGGCQSLLICDGTYSVLRSGGYPIGILDSCDIKVQRFFVRDCASLVMLTDGALSLKPEECAKVLSMGEKLSAQDLAAALTDRVKQDKTVPKDDVSVTVVKIKKR